MSAGFLYFLLEPYELLVSQRDDTNEGSYFAANAASASEVTNFIQDQSSKLTDAQAASVLSQYPLESNPTTALHKEYFGVASNAVGEAIFICYGIKLDRAYHDAGLASWNYRSVLFIIGCITSDNASSSDMTSLLQHTLHLV